MARASLLAGRALDRLLRWTERLAPGAAYRFKRHFYRPDLGFTLELLKRSGFTPAATIDVGAYVGDWAHDCRRAFPDTRVLMVEPSPARAAQLRRRAAGDDRFSVAQALLGASEGTAGFVEQDSNSRIAPAGSPGAASMAVTTLDRLVAGTPFDRAQLLKVDVQGHDLEVLRGGAATLAHVEVLVVELSLIPLHLGAPSVRTIVDWLDDRGFRLLDIAGLIRRPADDALWQMDAVFTRHESRLGDPARGW